MKKQVKKLSLSRETVYALEPPTLKAVHGADDSAQCVTVECGFSFWTCQLSGCNSCGCWTD
jgi:hypothetical protein